MEADRLTTTMTLLN